MSAAVVQGMQEQWSSWNIPEQVDKHLAGLKKMFMRRDPSFIDASKSDYMEYVK